MKTTGRAQMITLTAIATAGVAFGVSGISASAAELDKADTGDLLMVSQTETASAAKNAESSAKEVASAEKEVKDATETYNSAKSEKSEAENKAADAINNEKVSAKSNDDNADQEVKNSNAEKVNAERDVAEAEKAESDAKDNLDVAKETEINFKDTNTVTEEEINAKVAESENANAEANTAEAEMNNAKSAEDAATENNEKASEALTDAKGNTAQAKTADEKAQEDVNSAKTEDDKTAAELDSAENMRDNNTDITETTQYKEMKAAEEDVNQAKAAEDDAASKLNVAKTALSEAESDVAEKESAVNKAQNVLKSAEEKLNNALNNKEATDEAVENAEAAYEQAQAKLENAKKLLADAIANKTAAENDVKTAERNLAIAQEEATAAKDSEVNIEANETTNADDAINNAAKEVSEKQTVADKAKELLENAAEKYNQGILGFIDWMLEKTDLDELAKKDLSNARIKLINATNEDLSEWGEYSYTGDGNVTDIDVFGYGRNGKTVVLGDPYDASSIESIKKVFPIMYKINELRLSDENFTGKYKPEEGTTNFTHMVKSIVQAMRSSATLNHTNSTGAESLAWGYVDPTKGWYTKEKKYFDAAMKALGLETIDNFNDLWAVYDYASEQGNEVGHYITLLYQQNQNFGVGYTKYALDSDISCTWSYNATPYWWTYGKTDTKIYTIAEFEALFNEYLDTLDTDKLQANYNNAITELEAAKKKLADLQASNGTTISETLQKARDEVAKKEAAVKEASDALASAKEKEAKAIDAYTKAVSGKDDAEKALEAATNTLNSVKDNAESAARTVSDVTNKRDAAKTAVDKAVAELKAAVAKRDEAKNNVAEKQALLDEASANVVSAKAAYDEANKKLEDLTSDDTISKLQEEKAKTEAALNEALAKKAETEKALEGAINAESKAEAEAQTARKALEEANAAYETAQKVYAEKTEIAGKIAEELNAMKSEYQKVLDAVAAREAAETEFANAQTNLINAKTALETANKKLEDALASKEITADKLARAEALSYENAYNTPIEDDDFAYINDLIQTVKDAEAKLAEADANLTSAKANLAEKQAINAEWVKRAQIETAVKKAMGEAEKETNVPSVTEDVNSNGTSAVTEPGKQGTVAGNETGTTSAAFRKGASAEVVQNAIITLKSDADPAGTEFSVLQAKAAKVTNKKIRLGWKKVKGAKKYVVYANKCGKNKKYKKLKTLDKTGLTVSKVAGKKLKKGTYYKFLVVALDQNNNVISTSKTIHVATTGGKAGNCKSVTTRAKNGKVTVQKGKTFKLNAKTAAASKKIRVSAHRKIAYESSNPGIAVVSKAGKIRGVKKGICYVYAYAQDGVAKRIRVTVR